MKIFYLTLAAILLCSSANLGGQTTVYRNIQVTAGDSVIKSSVRNKEVKLKLLPKVDYYWYYGNKVNHNEGSFSGKLLHGQYEVFDKDQKLRVQGTYENGVKTGRWVHWYPDGKTRTICFYQSGMLNGELKTFYPDGKPENISQWRKGLLHGKFEIYKDGALTSVLNYRKGTLDGKCYYYFSDTSYVKVFRHGKEKIKPVKVKKEKKKLSEKQNPIEEKALHVEAKKKKSWWPFKGNK